MLRNALFRKCQKAQVPGIAPLPVPQGLDSRPRAGAYAVAARANSPPPLFPSQMVLWFPLNGDLFRKAVNTAWPMGTPDVEASGLR